MSLRRKATALAVAGMAAATLAVSASPASAAANHWAGGLGSGYSGHRGADPRTTGVQAYTDIYWDGYRVGVKGVIIDDGRDGLGALSQVSYWYWDGNSWKWTIRNLAITRDGYGSNAKHNVHSLVKVKWLKVRACTVTWTSIAGCSG